MPALSWKTSLRPNRSPNLPASTVAIVSVSRYDVTTHDTWAPPPRSPTIVGSAVETIVWSSAASSMPEHDRAEDEVDLAPAQYGCRYRLTRSRSRGPDCHLWTIDRRANAHRHTFQVTSYRSRFITLSHAATKSLHELLLRVVAGVDLGDARAARSSSRTPGRPGVPVQTDLAGRRRGPRRCRCRRRTSTSTSCPCRAG